MRILIVSDTHRSLYTLEKILRDEPSFDMMIHCGDIEGQEDIIFEMTGPECACVLVPGNNDFMSYLPRERSFEIEGLNIWVTHGHSYYVSIDPSIIREEAQARNVNVVMFGHTHKPLVKYEEGVYLINPGSLTYPRQEGRRASYIVMYANKGKAPEFEIKYL